MKRRSFINTLATTGLFASLPQVGGSDDDTPTAPGLSPKEYTSEVAERILPGTDLEKLVVKSTDFAEAAPSYECYQTEADKAPFANWLEHTDVTVTTDDVAVRGYFIPEEVAIETAWPRIVDWGVVGTANADTDAVISAAKEWEDRSRESQLKLTKVEVSTDTITHDRGLSRRLLSSEKKAYRTQRLRHVGDRLFVTWIEGAFNDDSYLPPRRIVSEIEQAIFHRQIQAHVKAGHTLPTVSAPVTPGRWVE